MKELKAYFFSKKRKKRTEEERGEGKKKLSLSLCSSSLSNNSRCLPWRWFSARRWWRRRRDRGRSSGSSSRTGGRAAPFSSGESTSDVAALFRCLAGRGGPRSSSSKPPRRPARRPRPARAPPPRLQRPRKSSSSSSSCSSTMSSLPHLRDRSTSRKRGPRARGSRRRRPFSPAVEVAFSSFGSSVSRVETVSSLSKGSHPGRFLEVEVMARPRSTVPVACSSIQLRAGLSGPAATLLLPPMRPSRPSGRARSSERRNSELGPVKARRRTKGLI